MEQMIDENKPFFLKGNNGIGILFLHGWSSPPGEFLPLAKYLNSFGYSVYAPVLRGHGTKPEDLLGVVWRDWLEDAKQALEELKKDHSKIFVGGISMGGNLAMLMSRDEKVAGIIPMGAAARYKFHPLPKLALFFMGLFKTYRRKYYPPWICKHMQDRQVYSYYPVNSAKEVMRLADETKRRLSEITKPILIMQSTADHMVSKRSPKIFFEEVSSKIKEIFWIKDVYHVFVKEKVVWSKIEEFIRSVLANEKKLFLETL